MDRKTAFRKTAFIRIVATVLIFAFAFTATSCFGKSAVPTKEEALENCQYDADPHAVKHYNFGRRDLIAAWGEPDYGEDNSDVLVWKCRKGKYLIVECDPDRPNRINCMYASVTQEFTVLLKSNASVYASPRGTVKTDYSRCVRLEDAWFDEDQLAKLKLGTVIEVEFDGGFMETFPEQISQPYSVKVKDKVPDSEERELYEEAEYIKERFAEEQRVVIDVYSEEKPEVKAVAFYGISFDDISEHVFVQALYGYDYYYSQTTGLLGSPVNVGFDHIDDPSLSFWYSEEDLRGVPETNIIMLHYSEEDMTYYIMDEAVLDTDMNTITTDIEEGGVYALVDAYQWLKMMGKDASDYRYDYDPTAYDSDWERECNTGSIMELADKKWAVANAPDFHVSNPQELASAVYYINAFSDTWHYYAITLENDIDLTGYDWAPCGWYGKSGDHPFIGTVDGQGHTINGMHIDAGYFDAGFLGWGYEIEMMDISFTNAYVCGNGCVGIAGGEIYGTQVWENIHVQGEVVGSDNDYGAVIGREAGTTFRNCTVDVIANGEPFLYCSYKKMHDAETPVTETFTLVLNSDYSITRDKHQGFQNLSWHIEHDGVEILERLAENEETLDPKLQWIDGGTGEFTIYLVAFIDGYYVRVSNIIEYTI